MIGEVLTVGDDVVVTIPADSRYWGYDPCPDGTLAKVVGFDTMHYARVRNFGRKPGVYLNRCCVQLEATVGGKFKAWTEYSSRMEMVDQAEYDRRVEAWRAAGGPRVNRETDFVAELPELPFWEGDIVRCEEHDRAMIFGIHYDYIGRKRADGRDMPLYDITISPNAGWTTTCDDTSMELIERGRVWKHFHNVPIDFESVVDEVEFHRLLHLYEEVRNPECDLYRWQMDEALAAIKDGIGDCFTAGGPLASMTSINVIKLHDVALGRKIAALTLAKAA